MARYVALSVLAAAGLTVAFVGLSPVSRTSPVPRRAVQEAQTAQTEAFTADVTEPLPLRLGGVVLSVLAAFALAFVPMQEAQAARSGGRIGGSASAARRPPPRAPAAASSSSSSRTTVINKTTVIAPPPVVAAPPMMGMGVGFAPAPVVVAPPPTVGDIIVGSVVGGAINNAVYGGHHSGPTSTDRMLENQQRQDERQMDNQQREIEQLKAEISALKK